MPSRLVIVLIRWLSLPVIFCIDLFIPKRSELWIFCQGYPFPFNSNQRALFEYVCQQEQVKAYVLRFPGLSPLDDVPLDQQVNAFSWKGLWFLLRSGVIVIHHGYGDTFWGRCFSRSRRQIVNLWHGIPVKGLGKHGSTAFSWRQHLTWWWNTSFYSFTICASRLDRTTMSACFGLSFDRLLISGLPRNDWLRSVPPLQTNYIKQAEQKVNVCLKSRRLILYAPTFRPTSNGIYDFSPDEMQRLGVLLRRYNAVLGIRAHINRSQTHFGDTDFMYVFSAMEFPETQALLMATDILVTDYSSIWVDFLLLNKPMIGFMHDFECFESEDRPLLYDLKTIFPGPLVFSFDSFYVALAHFLAEGLSPEALKRQQQICSLFHQSFVSSSESIHRYLIENSNNVK